MVKYFTLLALRLFVKAQRVLLRLALARRVLLQHAAAAVPFQAKVAEEPRLIVEQVVEPGGHGRIE